MQGARGPRDVSTAATSTFDARAFRDALGCFATGVTLVTMIDRSDQPIALTVNSFNAVSLEPPLVLFSLARTASCFDDCIAAGRFAVNILAAEQEALSSRFARPGESRLNGIGFEIGALGCPLVSGALANFECRTRTTHDGGDHIIFIGEVETIVQRQNGSPLLYYRGRYGEVAAVEP